MSVLNEVYKRLHKNPNDSLNGIKLYHSDIYYVRYHLNQKFNKNYSLEEVYQLLESENMLPSEEEIE